LLLKCRQAYPIAAGKLICLAVHTAVGRWQHRSVAGCAGGRTHAPFSLASPALLAPEQNTYDASARQSGACVTRKASRLVRELADPWGISASDLLNPLATMSLTAASLSARPPWPAQRLPTHLKPAQSALSPLSYGLTFIGNNATSDRRCAGMDRSLVLHGYRALRKWAPTAAADG
jgi:hypothetical protein